MPSIQKSLSSAEQDLLRAIFEADSGQRRVPMGKAAELIDRASAAVTVAAKRLRAMGLVDYVAYHGLQLTPAGERQALELTRHHRLLECYLVEFLDYSWTDVHDEADRLEHAMSEELERRIASRVSDPTSDPHGAPIPSDTLEIVRDDARPLSGVEPGADVVVRRVRDRERAVLAYVAQLGLLPGATLQVRERLPFGGPLVLEVNGTTRHVGLSVTDQVFVEHIPDAERVDVTQRKGAREA